MQPAIQCAKESRQAADIAASIRAFEAPRRKTPSHTMLYLPVSQGEALSEGRASNYRAMLTRQICRGLSFDEHRHFNWRLEHKLVQALALNHFRPGVAPDSRGLGRQLQSIAPEFLRTTLERHFPRGFFIKPTLGDSSGDDEKSDRTRNVLAAVESGEMLAGAPSCISEEAWVIQERVPIRREYRVHSLQDRIIHDLTFRRYIPGNIPGERDAPNAFIQSLLDRLPAAFVTESLLGWDVALTTSGRFVVIEVNFCGFHPVYRRGYQCSGYFLDKDWGASNVARLLRFIERAYGMKVSIELDGPESPARQFYADAIRWKALYDSGART
jgi:ATP-grasp domain, R2K clade family 2